MANGQQKGQQNLGLFEAWISTQSLDDFKKITYRGQLNPGEIAKSIGCGKSALTQNPALRETLKFLEEKLRSEGVLPPLNETAKKSEGQPKQYDNTARKRDFNSRRVSTLEAENIEPKANVKELEGRLERFGELSETLSEMGFMPR